jgi:hypothetical protein
MEPTSIKKKYQGYLLGGKGDRCVGLTILPIFSKSDILKLLEPSEPVIVFTLLNTVEDESLHIA